MTSRKRTAVEDAISTLSNTHVSSTFVRAEALFHLIGWMRNPERSDIAEGIAAVLNLRYLAEHVVEEVTAGERLIELAGMSGLVFLNDDDVIYAVNGFKARREELEYLGDLIRFLLTFKSSTRKSRKGAASVRKAYFALSNRFFKTKWSKSEPTHDGIWRFYKASSAFIFIDQHLFDGLILAIDPLSRTFVTDVSKLLEDGPGLFNYLGMVRWAQGRLEAELYRSALEDAVFVRFPDTVISVPVHGLKTTKRQQDIMASYRGSA